MPRCGEQSVSLATSAVLAALTLAAMLRFALADAVSTLEPTSEINPEIADGFTGIAIEIGVDVEETTDVTSHPMWASLEHQRCGRSHISRRLYGGTDAALGAYPWMVRIGYVSRADSTRNTLWFHCAGVLLSELLVVTEAHCTKHLNNSLEVPVLRLGEHDTETDPDCVNGECADPVQDIQPAQIIVHRGYDGTRHKHDIAIIRLERAAELSYYVMTICMMSGSLLTKDFINRKTELAGWGLQDDDYPRAATVLKFVELTVVDNARCEESYHTEVGRMHICAGGVKSSCRGDSGGPLMTLEAYHGPLRYYLLGVVSYGRKSCNASGGPTIFTRIDPYTRWILENMRD